MNSLFKKLLILLSLFFSSYLYADNGSIGIHVSNESANEADGTMTFTITLDEAPIFPITVDYKSIDGTAIAGTAYEAVDDYLYFGLGVSSRTFTVNIIDNHIYEGDKYFKISVSSDSSGYYSAGDGRGDIIEDDFDQQPLTIYLHNQEIDETDDNNSKVTFTARLNKPAPAGGVTVSYETSDGSAKAGEDYVAKSGNIFIAEGDRDGFIEVDIIGDTIIETPDTENFNLKLTNVTVVDSIEKDEAICTIYDNDFYPEINFEQVEYSIIEGNSSQKMIDITFLFDEDVQDGASFHYETWDDTAEDEGGDNDYIYKEGDVNLTNGDRSYTIHIPINGDTKIENDESFFVGISNLNKLDWGNKGEVKVKIINDDGEYPTLTANSNTFSIVEGNSSQSNLNFTFHLDKPALAGSSFEYYTTNGSADEDDYDTLEREKFTFNGGEKNITISVKINGDTTPEDDEDFYLKFDNEQNLSISGSQTLTGTILNDDELMEAFECTTDGYLFSSNIDDAFTNLTTLDLNNKIVNANVRQFSDRHINAAGYNVNDNLIYGIGFKGEEINKTSIQLIQIDKNFKTIAYDVEGLPQGSSLYAHGDVDFNNKLYVSYIVDENGTGTNLVELLVIDLLTKKVIETISLDFSEITNMTYIKSADYAFNPTDNMLYTIDSDSNQLLKIDPISGLVTSLGTLVTDDTLYSVMTLFDKDGTFYFSNNGNTKLYSIDLSDTSNINLTPILFQDGFDLDDSGDGIKCAYSTVEKEIEPFTCDSSMYISSNLKRGSNETGKMWLHKIDTQQNPFAFEVVDDDGDSRLYNALAYSDAGDENSTDYIFGLYKDELVKMGRAGKVISLGTIDALSELLSSRQFFAGAAYGGYYYISGPGVDYDKIFKIALSDKSVTEIVLDKAISLLDFSFTPDGKYLHGIIDGGELVKIDIRTGAVTKIGSAHSGYQFDSTFSDKSGRFFANDSKGNGFFEFDLTTGDKLFLSQSQEASFNDGANCLKASLVFTDYSDAPRSYGKAWHNISNGIKLGDRVDHDIDAYYSEDADGDDINGVDDDDGVTLPDGSDLNGTYFSVNQIHQLKIKLAKEAYVNIWLDVNRDGHFDNGHDLVLNHHTTFTAGEHIVDFFVPEDAVVGKSYLRARVSTVPDMDNVGFSLDGEVEDYMVFIGSDALTGTFNVERTNSGEIKNINSVERNAWYTQVVGRDFDYSLVFYKKDMSAEQNISNVTVKIDLVNKENNASIYSYSFHIPETFQGSRIDITQPVNDLGALPASKDVRFRVTYGVKNKDEIIQADCLSNPTLCTEHKSDNARDNFAIRPNSFYIGIADKEVLRKENTVNVSEPLRMASGYEYNLTSIASSYENNKSSALGYDGVAVKELIFKSSPKCIDTNGSKENISFKNGTYNSMKFTHGNVGLYELQIADKTWTSVDNNQKTHDCIEGKSFVSNNPNELSGCNIEAIANLDLSFYPYQFGVNFALNNLPNSGHNDFIYMSDLKNDDRNTSLQLIGRLRAENMNGEATTNFTDGCVATNASVLLNTDMLTDEGNNMNIIHTSFNPNENKSVVNMTRMVKINDEAVDVNSFEDIENMNVPLNILKDKFLDENNGTVSLELRYNINKNLSQTINPVQFNIHNISINAVEASSTAEEMVDPNPFVPSGEQVLDETRNFYFTRVKSDKESYTTLFKTPISAPLNVEIFCDKSIDYCTDTSVRNHTDLTGSDASQNGWYLSTDHNPVTDGLVQHLSANKSNIETKPNGGDNIEVPHGRNDLVAHKFTSCTNANHKVTIVIEPDTALLYSPNIADDGKAKYSLSCSTKDDDAKLSGVGKTGHIVNSKANSEDSSKIDW